MGLSEEEIEFLEQHIPQQAVAEGSSVLICESGYLIEQFLDCEEDYNG